MAFLTTAITSRFPTTNNQLITSSNPRNQTTIQDGRVIVQQLQGRQGQSFAGIGSKSNATRSVISRNRGNNAAVQARVVRSYNCHEEGHMARQCTQPKRPRNSAWFKEKILLVQAQEAGQVLDEDQLAFLADPRVAEIQDTQTTITHNVAFQTDDLDAFDSNRDEAPGAKAVLMANLSSYDSDVISEITHRIAKCNAENIKNKNEQESLTDELERCKERVRIFEERQKVDLNDREKYIDSQMNDMILNKNAKFAAFQKEIDTLKFTKESRSKMIEKQNDLILKEKKVNISPINYFELNKLSEHFQKYFVPQKELSARQTFWLPISSLISEQLVVPPTSVKIQVPSELPKVSLVNKSFQKLKNHLATFDNVVKERTTTSAITEGTWGFEHTKEVFITQVIPFLNSLMGLFKDFDNGLHNEINEVKTDFNQMEVVVEQCSVDKKYLVHIAINSLEVIDECKSLRESYLEEYTRNLTLEAELSKMNELSITCSRLQNHCISLELKLQQNKESFQNNRSCSNLDAPALNEFFCHKRSEISVTSQGILNTQVESTHCNIKRKNVSDNNEPNNASVIAPGMFMLDLEPLSYRLKNNREAHEDYLQMTKEHTDTLRGLVT
ncbi:hypothetical protein Tco_0356342 [Tanacetum coccineum]